MRFYRSSGGENGPPRLWLGGLILAAIAMATSAARANTITVVGSQGTPGGAALGFTEFTYTAQLTGNSAITAGAYFVIYDFNGFAGFDNSPFTTSFDYTNLDSDSDGLKESWHASIQPVGPYPVGDGTVAGVGTVHTPSSDTGLFNLVFTYTGADPLITSPPNQDLVTVSALTGSITLPVSGQYGSEDYFYPGGPTAGPIQGIVQGVLVPGAGGPGTFVPLPTTAAAGMGIFGLLGCLRWRRRLACE